LTTRQRNILNRFNHETFSRGCLLALLVCHGAGASSEQDDEYVQSLCPISALFHILRHSQYDQLFSPTMMLLLAMAPKGVMATSSPVSSLIVPPPTVIIKEPAMPPKFIGGADFSGRDGKPHLDAGRGAMPPPGVDADFSGRDPDMFVDADFSGKDDKHGKRHLDAGRGAMPPPGVDADFSGRDPDMFGFKQHGALPQPGVPPTVLADAVRAAKPPPAVVRTSKPAPPPPAVPPM
jgi:hypothetical protein